MDARLREGVRFFNAGRYFGSHESLEYFYYRAEEENKPFVEGLIQLAAACRLFVDFGEVQGPARMVRQALIRLENYQPGHLGIRVKRLIQAMEEWADRIEADSRAAKGGIPKILLHRFFSFR